MTAGGVLRAGVARLEITPPLGVELCGYGPYLERTSTGMHDPLWCRALVLEADGEWLALISCDLIGVLQETTDRVRAALHTALGIPAERVMLTCTHTHSGPNTVRLIGWGEPDPVYRAGLPERIVDTVLTAAGTLRPARLAVGHTVVEGVARNRVQPDGSGLIDPEVIVLRISDGAGRSRAILFQFGAHPVVMGPRNRLLSGDWAGEAERRFEADPAGPEIACFLNGACGDINAVEAVTNPPDWEAVARLGERMHAAVAALLPTLVDETAVSIGAACEQVLLPLDTPDRAALAQVEAGYNHTPPDGDRLSYVTGIASDRFERAWAEAMRPWLARPDRGRLPVEVQALRLGPLALLGLPAEVFTLFGFQIKQRSPFRLTAVIGYANGLVGYIPRSQDYAVASGYGRYAAIQAPKILGLPPFRPEVGAVLVEASVRALTQVAAPAHQWRRKGVPPWGIVEQ